MRRQGEPVVILMADDDADDQKLTRKALTESRLVNELHTVEDGEELLDYLRRQGAFAGPGQAPRPHVILLDLNMPRKDGREALEEIKNDPNLCHIPVVVLTTSEEDEDIFRSYQIGASSYITKPVTFDGLVKVMQSLGNYWFQIVRLPQEIDNQ